MSKKQSKNKISKKYLFLDSFYTSYGKLLRLNPYIFRSVSIILVFLAFLALPLFSENPPEKSITSDVLVKKEVSKEPTELKRVREVGGKVVVDGSLQVFESAYIKVFDLVQTSTPVAPSTGHARIWLETTSGDLVIQFSNGTTRTLAAN